MPEERQKAFIPSKERGYKNSERELACGYNIQQGRSTVYTAMFLAILFICLSSLLELPLLALGAVPASLVAYWHYPMIEPRPQVGCNSHGFYLERLGFIGWLNITNATIETSYVRTMKFERLILTLSCNLETAIIAREVKNWWRIPMMKCWHKKAADLKRTSPPAGRAGGSRIVVELSHVNCSPEAIINYINKYRRVT
ncbi:hypothetical protein [Polycladidibacter stylochi]|uniref:hypothetical protein n=1 Tax=Polycladidibacter stylochi TaxID=1807766 RepID=UPI00082B5439|nr:hypothetical protein [Pseudovibrio stylochi]